MCVEDTYLYIVHAMILERATTAPQEYVYSSVSSVTPGLLHEDFISVNNYILLKGNAISDPSSVPFSRTGGNICPIYPHVPYFFHRCFAVCTLMQVGGSQ